MDEIKVLARGKVNLTLDVLGRYPDGYHQVEMVMQSVDLADEVTLTRTKDEIVLTSEHPEVPLGPENIAYRAAELLKTKYQVAAGVHIHIHKQIPVAGGMAGGSTNGAAVLIGLNQLWNLNLSQQELLREGFRLGADVPFCIMGGTAIARGKGEALEELPPPPELWLVLVKPSFGVSTAQVYGQLDLQNLGARPDTSAMVEALATNNLTEISANLVNVLESATLKLYPQVALIKQQMREAGALQTLMSGSGPTVFGLARDQHHAQQVAQHLQAAVDGQIIITRTTNQGCVLQD